MSWLYLSVPWAPGEWWDPCDRERWATSKRMLRAPHPEEGEQPDAEQGRHHLPKSAETYVPC